MSQYFAPSFICPVPPEPVTLCNNSIIIKDGDVEFIVGKTAQFEFPESARAIGGTLKTPQYQVLLKAIVALSLGEGEHDVSLALSVAQNWIENFREKPGSIKLSEENNKLLITHLKEIKFRRGSSDSAIKTCKINIQNDPTVYFETQAVTHCLPSQFKNYVLWQIGHGDLQQIVLIDGKPVKNALQRAEGLSGAIKRFARNTKLSEAEAIKAWHLGTRPESDEMNGKRVDCSAEKRKAAREYFSHSINRLLNTMQDYKERVRNIILSGGASKDDIAVEILRDEVEQTGWYKLHVINNLSVKNEKLEDPVFVCAYGLANAPIMQQYEGKRLGIDVGNFALKSVLIGE